MPGMMPNAPVDVTIRGSMPPPSDHATAMRKTATVATLAVLLAATAGCKQKVVEPATGVAAPATSSSATADQDAGRAQARLPRFATAARIAEIKASGRTGFWIDSPEFCPGRRVGVLTWNVEASGAQKVVVYAVGKDGQENHFGRGGPIGERQTGPWLRPGLTFKLRNADGGAELGSITIVRGKSC